MQVGVQMTTVYAFSTENWNRDPIEITTLMTIFAKYAETFRVEALAKNVKVNILSTEVDKLPVKVKASIEELMNATKDCNGFTLNICLSYGGRGDILHACKSLAKEVQIGQLQVTDIQEDLFS
jgi:undecaprenyl diphosphate synthase